MYFLYHYNWLKYTVYTRCMDTSKHKFLFLSNLQIHNYLFSNVWLCVCGYSPPTGNSFGELSGLVWRYGQPVFANMSWLCVTFLICASWWAHRFGWTQTSLYRWLLKFACECYQCDLLLLGTWVGIDMCWVLFSGPGFGHRAWNGSRGLRGGPAGGLLCFPHLWR